MILGNGGHAQVLADCLLLGGFEVDCRTDETEIGECHGLVLGMADVAVRKRLIELFGADVFVPVVHPSAVCSPRSIYGRAPQLMAGAIVQPNTRIGDFVILNTGAQIDHHGTIGDYSFIGPGAVLCGNVTLGAECYIGANATIVPGVTLESGTFVKAGTLVVGPDDFRAQERMVLDYRTGAPTPREALRAVLTRRTARLDRPADAQPRPVADTKGNQDSFGADL